jgi:hypothetical protein
MTVTPWAAEAADGRRGRAVTLRIMPTAIYHGTASITSFYYHNADPLLKSIEGIQHNVSMHTSLIVSITFSLLPLMQRSTRVLSAFCPTGREKVQ